ncbi:MAG: hypothetical protein EPO65_02620 [Dehalococcoidia bacterium]|nr:MAG: hypothetical protein EPO65_02620 [Dehalococcoidia bacterium]
MGLGLAIVACLVTFIVVGIMVVQARFAARAWRRTIAAGDTQALHSLLDQTLEGWRNGRPPRRTPPADWRALHTASVVAADRERIRVSLLAEPDVRVIDGQRVEAAGAQEVARRAAVRMVERLMYEMPHVSFVHAQVDVLTEFRSPGGDVASVCLLSTQVTREQAADADWEGNDHVAMLAEWQTVEDAPGRPVDPDADAVIAPPVMDPADAVRAAEAALRAQREKDGDA